MTPRRKALQPFTVVGLSLDHDELIIEHVYARNGRGAIRAFLVGRADSRRALVVFAGHLKEAK